MNVQPVQPYTSVHTKRGDLDRRCISSHSGHRTTTTASRLQQHRRPPDPPAPNSAADTELKWPPW
ncbi:hypothetical protein LINGRAHAP2_LOCUS6499 [Linum grandiflorum]